MDSDEEYDRRRGRDKFRRERSDYNDRRERDDRRRGGDDWGDRRRDRGEVRRDWNRRDYNDYDRGGGRRDRYNSPPRGRDMSPPNKRMRRDWGDGGGYQGGGGGGYNDMGYGGGPGGGYGGGQGGGWGPPGGRGRNRRGGGPDIDPTGPMMSFKAFLAAQDDNIDDQEAVRKYNEYKMEYKKAQLSEFFLAHKDEEWFRFKYYPDEAEKRHQETLAAVHHRLVVFLDVFQRGLVDDAKGDADSSMQIIKLLDAAVIKMEGGSELDMTILDQPPSPRATPGRQRSTSERSRRTSEMSDKGDKSAKSSDERKTTDGEDGELKEEDEQDEKKEKTDEEKKDEPEKEKKDDEEKKEKNIDANGDHEDGEEADKDKEEKEKDESKEEGEKSKEEEEKEEGEKEKDTPEEPKETPKEEEKKKEQRKPTFEEKKEQHSVSEVLKKLMMGGHKEDKEKERSQRGRDRKRKRKREYSSDESHSGSSSDSFTTSSSGSSSESSDSEDERHDRDKKGKKHNRKDSKASEGKPTEKESGEIKDGKEEGEEKEEGEKEPEEPKPRALHKTYSLFVRNVAPVITKEEIKALCKRYPGFMRVALAEPQAERNFQRHGWITFDRSVNIKEICWNLSSIRLRDCELSPVVNRELSNRVRSVSGITAHKTVVRADLKLAARLVQQLDDKNKLWRDDFELKEKERKEKEKKEKEAAEEKEKEGGEQPKEEPSEDLVTKFKRNPVLENITEYLVEEASAEEEVLLGASADLPDLDSSKDSTADVPFEKDDELNKVLDRLLFYLRVVHSVDYYTGSQYHIEDEMPNRCGIMHVRGSNPPNRITEKDLDNWEKHFEGKLGSLLNTANELVDDDVLKLGKKDQEAEVEKFVKANTQELAKDKWLCPLSGKKFKGPEFVRKHIFNKHGDKVEDVKKEVTFFNNYLKDPRRPQLPDPQTSKPAGNQPGGGGPEQRQGGGSWGGGGGSGFGASPQGGYGSGGGGFNQQGGRGGFNQGQNQGAGGQQNFSNRGFNQRYNQGSGPYSGDRNRTSRGGSSGRGRSRGGDPRPLIQYRDLDAPDDNDFF